MAIQVYVPGDTPGAQDGATVAVSPVTVVSVDAPGPSVWLTSLNVPGRVPFAADGFETAPVLPRSARVLASLPDRDADTPRQVAASEPPVAQAVETPSAPSAQAIAHAIPEPQETAGVTPDMASALAEALRHHGAAPISGGLLVGRLAPRRSPLPQARPQAIAAAHGAAPGAEPAQADAQAVVLARSRLPLRRPETVARLASLDLTAPAPALTRDPEPRTAAVELPALGRAVARADQCESRLTRAVPRRGRAEDGSSVIARLADAHGRSRDDALIAEVVQGNMPDFLRDLVPVTFTGSGPNGQAMRVTICVMPDYLAIGSDRDFVRVPLGLPAAMRVAERFDMVLPTTTMVDAIFAQANVRLAPSPMTPGAQMESTGYFQRHNATVQQQLASAGGQLGQLVAGHKKDLVLTNRIERNPGRVAIYGWHRPSGRPIQPLSTVHGAQYADYSHGVRLVARTAYVNGRATDLRDLLADGRYAGLISSEGPITNRTLLAALR